MTGVAFQVLQKRYFPEDLPSKPHGVHFYALIVKVKFSQSVKSQTVLVAGGTEYIGTHVVKDLVEQGSKALVVDDLSGGNQDLLRGLTLQGA